MRLQAYRAALESLGHSEYALKAGFHLNPKAVEGALQVGPFSFSEKKRILLNRTMSSREKVVQSFAPRQCSFILCGI